MAITTTTATLVNSTQLGGTQSNVQTAGLANGGHVVAWTSDLGGQKDVYFQRFDAQGNKLGGPVLANSTGAGDQVLNDILVRADGSFVLCWSKGNTVTTRGFDGATGLALTAESNVNTVGANATGAQIILTDASNYKVVMSSNSGGNTVVEQASFFANGGANGGKAVIPSILPAGVTISEVVDGNSAGTQFILLSDGSLVSSGNGSTIDGNGATDILKLQTGLHVLADESEMNAMLVGLTGLGGNLAGYSTGGGQVSGGIVAEAPAAPDVFARKLVDLGNGRVLVVWVADTGIDPEAVAGDDGIYAAVYDTNIAAFVEDGAYLVRGFGQGDASAVGDLSAITLEASLLADGQVAVSWSVDGGLTGADIFSAIIDPRYSEDGGISLAGTEAGETLIGTKSEDTISGGGGNDTIVTYSGDDTIIGGDGNDVIYAGDEDDDPIEDSDNVDAGDGRDFVATGVGKDTIYGGQGADVLNAGSDDDVVYGGDGNDTVAGGDGLDVLEGGAGTDTLTLADSGGGYVDLDYNVSPSGLMAGFDPNEDVLVNFENIIGSVGADYLAGSAGVNVLRGESGADYLQGRGDADRLRGGAGSDGFVYEFATEGGDAIRGFDVLSDKIVIVAENFGGIDEQSILASLNINANGSAQSSGAKFIFDNSGTGAGQLYYDADGSASGSARVLLATIRFSDDLGVSLFSAANFEFV